MPSFTVYKGSKDGTITAATTSKPDLTGDQVLIKVTASGLCGTDVHYRNQSMALGHEGVGRVESLGPAVQHLSVGDRVGWGYEVNSCGLCSFCQSGRETFCSQREFYGTANFDQGSLASHAVWREAFLYKIPDDMSDEEAAPMMCGGATVFNALHMYAIPPTARIGVIGVGGLGHLAIQFAAKMGAEVVVFSGTDSKKEEAMKLGAKEFVAMKGKDKLDIKPIDTLLVTTSAQPDWSMYLPILAPEATIFPLSVAEGNLEVPYMPIILQGLRIQGSVVAPRYIHKRMLEFAARNGIKPMLNKFPLNESGIEDAFKALDEGKMRYRGVLIPEEK
ncbi:GroES-like protein [Aulographum hederae CBS 113979]|uniref:GroES-like protein n=1 Tax=Aulographum hederae CBS 113979 TaxID=1176131 RepID=A0A6G1H0H0_9PEZI|nr:GroES-like protein [Aulographum hederae CBS 113979]